MPTSLEIVKIPLELYQVLEEEYASLHEPIPEGENFFIELPDPKEPGKWRRVKAARDWCFYEGHLKDPGSFARSLLPHAQPPQGQTTSPPAGPPAPPPPGVNQDKVKDYLGGAHPRSDQEFGRLGTGRCAFACGPGAAV